MPKPPGLASLIIIIPESPAVAFEITISVFSVIVILLAKILEESNVATPLTDVTVFWLCLASIEASLCSVSTKLLLIRLVASECVVWFGTGLKGCNDIFKIYFDALN